MGNSEIQVLGICGSLRKKSFNMAGLRAAGELMPAGMTMTIAEIGDMPLYNQDVLDAGMPEAVKRFRAQLKAADGVLIASPEYNFSVTPALKNAIDWASRPPDQPWQDMPIAIFSCTGGPVGGARVQYDLRKILTQIWGHVLPRPEVFIGNSASKFDAEGRLTDETTRKFLTDLLVGFQAWIERMHRR